MYMYLHGQTGKKGPLENNRKRATIINKNAQKKTVNVKTKNKKETEIKFTLTHIIIYLCIVLKRSCDINTKGVRRRQKDRDRERERKKNIKKGQNIKFNIFIM